MGCINTKESCCTEPFDMLTNVKIPLQHIPPTPYTDLSTEQLDQEIKRYVSIDIKQLNDLFLEKHIRIAKSQKQKSVPMYRCNYYFVTPLNDNVRLTSQTI